MGLGATALAAAAPAHADHVAVVIADGSNQPTEGAHGRLVAGVGTTVTRRRALAALLSGRVHDAHLGDFHPEDPVISLSRRPGEITIYVELPAEGTWKNEPRFEITIVGGEYRFPRILVSDSTRIPGLISIADVAPTVQAIEAGRAPPITWREADDPYVELAILHERLSRAELASTPATIALALLMAASFLAAVATRRALLARMTLLVAPAAISVALVLSALDPVRHDAVAPVLALLAALVAYAAASLLRSEAALGRGLVVFLGGYALLLALAPEVNAFAPIGPHPWSGGRFYGVTNLVETLLVACALAAAALLPRRLLLPVALLTVITIGGSETGADGGGILVVSAAFIALWLRSRPDLPTRRELAVAAAAAAAAAFAFVGIDAAAGGSSHVVDAVGSGSELADELTRRLRLSYELATESLWSLAAFVGGVGVLTFFATRTPRYASVDAFLVALAVSLVANDHPIRVVGFGALACATLWAFERFQPSRRAE